MSPSLTDPNQIIELQLKSLLERARMTPLTYGDCRALESLIRCRLLLERVALPPEDSELKELTADELKALLETHPGVKGPSHE